MDDKYVMGDMDDMGDMDMGARTIYQEYYIIQIVIH